MAQSVAFKPFPQDHRARFHRFGISLGRRYLPATIFEPRAHIAKPKESFHPTDQIDQLAQNFGAATLDRPMFWKRLFVPHEQYGFVKKPTENPPSVIASVGPSGCVLFGAHHTSLESEKSIEKAKRKGGVGESVPIALTDTTRYLVFAVRFKTN